MNRTEQFLYALTVAVRALTQDQAMRLLGINDTSNMGRFAKPLIERDLVRTCRVFALPVPTMRAPLLAMPSSDVGVEGDTTPTVEVVNRVLRDARRRWAGRTATPVTCYIATRRAGRMHGVRRTGSLAHPLQATHDLAVSGLYVRLVLGGHIRAESWQGEDFGNCRYGDKNADALLTAGEDHPRTVIEVVGADYTRDKLLAISGECNLRGLHYEFW